MTTDQHDIFLSFYGDDFTGSTDAMEALALNGMPTALFLQPPSPQEVQDFRLKHPLGGSAKKLRALGVAGISRSLTPKEMDEELPPIFEKISRILSQYFHYKICSTFDSSPTMGNIGHAVDLAFQYFPSDFIPLLVGAPSLNRFCLFGNLFARVGPQTYRLDRHPTMSQHPVTPMTESDLRLHLGKQTTRPVQLMDVFALEASLVQSQEMFDQLNRRSGDYLLFDTYREEHLNRVGELIHTNRRPRHQLLVGASGTEYALCQHLQRNGLLEKPTEVSSPGPTEQLIVVGGSCSPTTQQQLDWVIARGFVDIRINAEQLVDPTTAPHETARVQRQVLDALSEGKSVVFYTAKGPDDPAINAVRSRRASLGKSQPSTSELLAGAQGQIVKEVLERCGKKRVVVAGGDTSGYVARALGIYALETLMPIAPGAPLCTAHSRTPAFDGLEISLKGGQNGQEEYFESILRGRNISA